MSNLLSIPNRNNLDTLVLSSASFSSIYSSSSSTSTSTSSLFGSQCISRSSSATDISSPSSPLHEVGDCTNGEKWKLPLFKYNRLWKEVLETPTPSMTGRFSPASHRSQGPPTASIDETGYEAEASDGDESSALVQLKNRKKKLVKSRARSEHWSESEIYRLEQEALDWSSVAERQGDFSQDQRVLPPRKPVLCPQSLNLNSPSPIVALPSPRSFDPILHQFWDPQSLMSSTVTIAEPLYGGTASRKSTQKSTGLGLRIPGISEQCSRNYVHSIETTTLPDGSCSTAILSSDQTVKNKGAALIGLGIKLPTNLPSKSLSHSYSSVKPVSLKSRSFSVLGNGLPSTLARGFSTQFCDGDATSITVIPSSVATIRLVDSTERIEDSAVTSKVLEKVPEQASCVAIGLLTGPLNVDLIRQQRRAALSLKPFQSLKHLSSQFRKRHLYPIFELSTSVTHTGNSTFTSTSHCALNSTSPSNSKQRKSRSFSRSENNMVNSFSKMPKSLNSAMFRKELQ
ncbi:hypothetical protein J3R30DRAFT_2693971 [Lentinula aciculospora]|uniref:Uncharacterized protein n=1 Tax=Lentinula aciculospora TaxID=153920 RepID=A0A9W9ACN1_9AGAR|nr:hypothetical protein J3R30DRAFT_2693971 [Lentinula aciculospora]